MRWPRAPATSRWRWAARSSRIPAMAGCRSARAGPSTRCTGRISPRPAASPSSPPPFAAKRAYHEAGITRPRDELSLIEVHDCFSVTELVTMEDLAISPEGGAVKDVLDGFYDADGAIPCQIDGGLKCFGHPIGASGLRMIYEIYLQMQGRAGARQRQTAPIRGLVHNLGGFPHQHVCSIAIIGRQGA